MCYDLYMEKFNEKLKQLRLEHNLSQQEIAQMIGITRSAYSNYEQGLREPDLKTFKKICASLKIHYAELLDYID